jgi:Protein of unknown function (DUF3047)
MAHADPTSSHDGSAALGVVARTVGLLSLIAACLVLPAVPARTDAQSDCRTIDDFSKDKVGEFPPDWKPRKDAGKEVYRVAEESGIKFLHAAAKGLGIQAAKEYEWDLGAYPMLVWSWRPIDFPKGSDERDPKTNDSALAVYMLVPYSRMRGPKAVKYVWSEKVPVGTKLESNMGLTQVRVLRSGGPEKKGEWVEERVNVLEDYKKYFDVKETPKPAGIAVLTDSDDTNSSAQGDYANFRVCRQ